MKTPKLPTMRTMYYRREQGRYGGKLNVVSILKVENDGNIYCIDLTRMKTSTMKTFGGIPMYLFNATEKDWDDAKKKIAEHYK